MAFQTGIDREQALLFQVSLEVLTINYR